MPEEYSNQFLFTGLKKEDYGKAKRVKE